jgi:hypothetical protein
MSLYVKYHQQVMHHFDECTRNLVNDRNEIFCFYFEIFVFVFCSPSPTIEEVTVHSAVYEDGRATCEFSFDTTSEQADGEPAPIVIEKNYHLIFAAGILRTEGRLYREKSIHKNAMTFLLIY